MVGKTKLESLKLNTREKSIDILRGLTVALMIITHVIAITYDFEKGTSGLVYHVGLIGGIASFTSFLFISGISSFFAYYKNGELAREKYRKIIIRTLKIVLVFYLLAVAFNIASRILYLPVNTLWLKQVVKIISFLEVPEFTEFLITLAFFSLSILIFSRFYLLALRNKFVLVAAGVGSFVLGLALYTINFESNILNYYKSLLAGHGNLHTFPLLQYFPIFLLGLYFGKFLLTQKGFFQRVKGSSVLLIGSSVVTIISVLIYSKFDSINFYPMPNEGRFPPSIGFLGLSLTISLILLLGSLLIDRYKNRLVNPIIFIGEHALGFFLLHELILFAFKFITSFEGNFIRFDSFLEILGIFVIVMLSCFGLLYLNDHYGSKVYSLAINKNVLPKGLAFASCLILGFLIYSDILKPNLASEEVYSYERIYEAEKRGLGWWNDSYEYYRKINISDKSSLWIMAELDRNNCFNEGKCSEEDLRVIALKANSYRQVPFVLVDGDHSKTKIAFKKLGDEDYFLYYGNKLAESFAKLEETVPSEIPFSPLGEEFQHEVDVILNHKWFLKTPDSSLTRNLNFQIKLDERFSNNILIFYSVSGDAYESNIKVEFADKNNISIDYPTSDLKPGIYFIKATILDLDNQLTEFTSTKRPFYVSYPMYVTWTIDWEGWDVAYYDLAAMASITSEFKIPMTHFFNPRIYTEKQDFYATISKERAEYLTAWMKDRYWNYGEEVGMHLHMFPDMLKELEITPKGQAVSGAMYGDTLVLSYTADELEKILTWGKEKFEENGLPEPISFRAGGWMASLNSMEALERTGFLIDSSGRTAGAINPLYPNGIQVPWNLKETTTPYRISRNDMNRWDGSLFDLWEFPNNGADSYWFSASDMKNRLDANFSTKEKVMTKPQVVTFLSHPHWYSGIDHPKIKELFTYSNQFLFQNDNGPIVNSTLQNAYTYWEKDKFLTGE
jgi:uncharacterized membrane protein